VRDLSGARARCPFFRCPDPTRDFAAAGELLEEMPSPLLRKLWDGTGWECASGAGHGFASADTKELAICLSYYAMKTGHRAELKETP